MTTGSGQSNETDFTARIPYETPFPPLTAASNTKGFAYVTVKDRMPVILTKTIDTLSRLAHDPSSSGEVRDDSRNWLDSNELQKAIQELGQLRYELQHDKPLTPLQHNVYEHMNVSQEQGQAELADWNARISYWAEQKQQQQEEQVLKKFNSWFGAPWLFVECFMYRKIADILHPLQTQSRRIDPFREQKQASLKESFQICLRAAENLNNLPSNDKSQLKQEFEMFLHASLWGNQIDLSMHAGKSSEEFQANLHQDHVKASQSHLIINDTDQLFECLIATRARLHGIDNNRGFKGKVHVILDNSGAELFMDLCLADWMLRRNVSDSVQFHCKLIPWFVSDVTFDDLEHLLTQMESNYTDNSIEKKDMKMLSDLVVRWRAYFASGQWTITASPFYTSYHQYSPLKLISPSLYSQLTSSSSTLLKKGNDVKGEVDESILWIFKGDLNYRKLVQDCAYPYPFTTPFEVALGKLKRAEDTKRPPLLALRTCKADVISGLDSGKAEELDRAVGPNVLADGWLVTGKFGIIQFSL